eukprot:TRINITY_DN716_c0_g1::TRINITY_DN716_c0_g1_i1::g.18388::m.18388 TRINITY_DN716_c0_g1::TRINITY_DN716_c0_g1_i1::g.18388  ORF type:complete len:898 (+),score=194.27,sp/Q338C0/AARE2_ORYSJ/30.65/8e-64,sp/Q338C0/AARE2_ORYSJ/30.10/1e-12,Peptidase_S9/PF00326.16/5.5e-33,Abhydrolase_5/PF12695.2/1.4e-08,Abhydrolase_6/PF12697.2/2.9e-06,Abhydrolase_3/PF07859.8/8.4e-05,COesterase/PF00135.23/0.0077,CDKN3/PF05706.7/0.016,PD40/PF07676.7/0.22,PD40/PF07676.7/3.7e+03,PD40/PF07676.7/7.3e+03,DLH/PF01738.13/0.1 TRINITY_D
MQLARRSLSTMVSSTMNDSVKSLFQSIALAPTFSSGFLSRRPSSPEIDIKVVQSQKDVVNSVLRKSLRSFSVNTQNQVISSIPFSVPLGEDVTLLSLSPSGGYMAVFKKLTGTTPGAMLELYNQDGLLSTTKLEKVHGDVYGDGPFAGLMWRSDEKAFAYAAEKKRDDDKHLSFYEPLPAGKSESDVVRGQKSNFKRQEDWGEQLRGQRVGRIYIASLKANGGVEKVDEVAGIPESLSVGQPVWSNDGSHIVFTAYEIEPRRVGLKMCTNRSSCLYIVPVADGCSSTSLQAAFPDSSSSTPPNDYVLVPDVVGMGSHNNVAHQLRGVRDLNLGGTGATGGMNNNHNNNVNHSGITEIQTNSSSSSGSSAHTATSHASALKNPVNAENNMGDVIVRLTEPGEGATFPKFTPKGDSILYICNPDLAPHNGTKCLKLVNWREIMMLATQAKLHGGKTVNLPEPRTVLDVVSGIPKNELEAFPGLYSDAFSNRMWLDDGVHIVMATSWRSQQHIVCINTDTGMVRRVRVQVTTPQGASLGENGGAWNILDVSFGQILLTYSSPNRHPCLVIASARQILDSIANSNNSSSGNGNANVAIDVTGQLVFEGELRNLEYTVLSIPPSLVNQDLTAAGVDQNIEAIMVRKRGVTGPLPLVVMPHGGPHSAYTSSFDTGSGFLAELGFMCALINYRGSLGFGHLPLLSLTGRAGTQDISDCVDVVKHLTTNASANANTAAHAAGWVGDASRVAACGGSHGGFLTAHLMCVEQGKLIKGAIMRNPVCNISAMITATDIPEWCTTEGVGPYITPDVQPWNPEHIRIMHEASPIARVKNAKCPSLFLMGGADFRVPPSQGLEFYHTLRHLGCEADMLWFPEENHSLTGVSTETENWLNIYLFLTKHLHME